MTTLTKERQAKLDHAIPLSSPEVCDFMVRRARAGASRREIRAEIKERFGIDRSESTVREKINRLLLNYVPERAPETVPEIRVDKVTFERSYKGRVRTVMTVTLPAISWDEDSREWSE